MLKLKLVPSSLLAIALTFSASSLFSPTQSFAAVSPGEAKKLKSDLTPFGAVRAGNKEGTIPAWDGGITKDKIPESYKRSGQHHPDPFVGEEPILVITANNLAKHKDKVPEGLQALLKTYPSFYMPIYPTHRTASAPEWVYKNTYVNAMNANLARGGNGIQKAYGGIPFPIPKNGRGLVDPMQILWNHITRWRGTYIVNDASEVAVHRNGRYQLITSHREIDFNYYHQDSNVDSLNNILFYYLSFTKKPTRLAGGAILVHETLDQTIEPRQAWGYNAGQRRIRRAPSLAYDAPISTADGLRTADDTDIYNGAPDRYDWTFVGVKEMYIPYNNYLLDSGDIKYKDMLTPGHVNPEFTRYELHRVWVIEANLKKGQRHVYQKRRFYIDEDSWSIAVADQFDGRGDLWRVSVAYLKNYYDVPTLWSALDVFHDLLSKRYHVQLLDNEESETLDFSQASPGKRYFKPSSLRRRGRR